MSKFNVVVTGGSSGIGAAMVHCFASLGHNVLYTYFSHPPLHEIPTKNIAAEYLDQGNPESVHQFAKKVNTWLQQEKQRFASGKLDILINNAALGSATVQKYLTKSRVNLNSCYPASVQKWEAMEQSINTELMDLALMRVNALGPLWVSEALIPLMLPPGNSQKPLRNPSTGVLSKILNSLPKLLCFHCSICLS
jgi:NAD(P)-dependent dehydrogenase (short-subunit alcohol dehydrogenase family)